MKKILISLFVLCSVVFLCCKKNTNTQPLKSNQSEHLKFNSLRNDGAEIMYACDSFLALTASLPDDTIEAWINYVGSHGGSMPSWILNKYKISLQAFINALLQANDDAYDLKSLPEDMDTTSPNQPRHTWGYEVPLATCLEGCRLDYAACILTTAWPLTFPFPTLTTIALCIKRFSRCKNNCISTYW